MITSFIEMLELPGFGHMTTIQFDSRDKILLMTSWTQIMTPYDLYFKIYFI